MKKTIFPLLLLIISLLFSEELFCQHTPDSLDIKFEKNGISKPSLVSTNPFGIFISTYVPDDEAIRNEMRGILWFSRQYLIDVNEISASNYEIETDGVIKGLRANVTFPIGKQQELTVGMRAFMLTNGKFPFSAFTNDTFIGSFV